MFIFKSKDGVSPPAKRPFLENSLIKLDTRSVTKRKSLKENDPAVIKLQNEGKIIFQWV